jgi:uncharacterized membrane protein
MAPLIALVVVTLALLAAGAAGVRRLKPWPVALRGGLAAMFLLTGGAHFIGMRAELISMVPPGLPDPALLVSITGVLELAGAAGLLLSRTAPLAAGALAALLVVMFPANVYAAVAGIATSWEDALVPRTLLQLVFVGAALAVVAAHVRGRRRSRSAVTDRADHGAALTG